MKKLLLILLCLPLLFSCGGNLDKEITTEMRVDGYTGKGTYTWANGNKYVGEWKDDLFHGQGTFTWPNGGKYVGEFKDNKNNGQGTLTFANGSKYVGEFKDNSFNGQGTYTWASGNKYVGEWKDDKQHGQGTYTYGKGKWEGDKYVGEYKDGKKDGQGTYLKSDGEKYVGEYKDGNRHGQGTYTSADGIIKEGLFEDNKFLGDVLICVEEIKNCIGYGGGEHAIDLCCSSPINQYCVNGLTYEVNRENGKKWVSDMRAWVKQEPKNKEKLFFLSEKLKFESRKTGNKELYYLAMELIEEVIIYGI